MSMDRRGVVGDVGGDVGGAWRRRRRGAARSGAARTVGAWVGWRRWAGGAPWRRGGGDGVTASAAAAWQRGSGHR